MAATLFPSHRVNAVPLQYDPTFEDLAGRVKKRRERYDAAYDDVQGCRGGRGCAFARFTAHKSLIAAS